MWIFLSVVVVCTTILYWSSKYLIPVQHTTGKPVGTSTDIEDADQPVNFDDIIAEIYDRLEEDNT